MAEAQKKSEKDKGTGVALANQFTQADIPNMLEQVNEKIAQLTKGQPKEPQTTGELDGFGKIAEIKDTATLIKAHSSVVNREKFYNESAEEILPETVKKPPFKLNGFSSAQWTADIKKRVIEVSFKQELAKLKQVKTKLEANLSAEAKLAKDLKDISNILTS